MFAGEGLHVLVVLRWSMKVIYTFRRAPDTLQTQQTKVFSHSVYLTISGKLKQLYSLPGLSYQFCRKINVSKLIAVVFSVFIYRTF